MILDPFSKLYRIDDWVVKRSPLNPFSAKAGFLVAAALILAFWSAVAIVFELLLPTVAVSVWLGKNWQWAFIATAMAYVGYSFCRTFLETKTIVRGSDAK